jgi:50S ribosomal subunit-associated GTPase HflX
MDEWAEGFQKTVGRVPLVFLINKSDLIDIATFDSSEAEAIARKYSAPLYFTSAKTGDNVERSFLELGNTLTYSFFKKINVISGTRRDWKGSTQSMGMCREGSLFLRKSLVLIIYVCMLE